MTAEQRKKLKEMRATLPKILQSEIKMHGFKKKDYMIWHKKDELFFTLMFYIRELDGRCFLDIKEQFKPIWVDDLLWDILQMQENKRQPISFRCIGAFTVSGALSYRETVELKDWSAEEVSLCVKTQLENFATRINTINHDDFLYFTDSHPYHAQLRRLLLLIHEKQYREAIIYSKNMDNDCFVNKGVGLRELAVQYCEQYLQSEQAL